MLDFFKDLAKDLAKDLGLFASLSSAIAWLWGSGLVQWAPALLVLTLGVYTLLLHQQLPWQRTAYRDFEQLLEGKGTHRQLLPKLRKACANAQHGQDANASAEESSRWMRSMVYAQRRLDAVLGPQIWTFQGFNKLLLFAVAYPLFFLLLVWWWTDVGMLGQATVLASLGAGWGPFLQRTGFVLLVLWPLLIAWWVKRHRPLWVGAEAHWWSFVVVFFAALAPASLFYWIWPGQLAAFGVVVIAVTGSAVAGTFAVAGTPGLERGVVAGLAGGAFIYAFAGYDRGEYALAVSVIFASVVAVMLMFKLISDRLDRALCRANNTLPHAYAVIIVSFVVFFAVCVSSTYPLWSSALNQMPKGFSLRSTMVVFGAAWMPIINALFDWVSLGITRELLRRMTRSPAWMWGGLVLDVLVGVLLTLALLVVALGVLHLLQWLGWTVDARAVRLAFVENPLDPSVSWLAMLAVTNMLPTSWHLVVSLWGLVDRQFTHDASHVQHLRQLNDALDDNGQIRAQAVTPTLGDLDKINLFNSLFVHPWLYVLTVLALVCGLWGSYLQALRWVLSLWPIA